MKKYIIGFLLFIIALTIIAMASSSEPYDDVEGSDTTVTPLTASFVDLSTDEIDETEEIEDIVVPSVEYDTTAIEIPAMIRPVPNQILVRKGYTTSYNNQTKNANWVAWHLTREHTDGPWSRKGIQYSVDKEVVGARQELEDWYNINLPIDHGHMCPAGDNKWDEKAMIESFYLTNMSPQHSDLNNGDWRILEERCRGWARHYGDLYITCGPLFYSDNYKTIGTNKVGVPDAFFKVVLCLNKKPKALGFIFPNEGESHSLKHYVLSVDEVEDITGIDYFQNLPDDIENKIEASSNINEW